MSPIVEATDLAVRYRRTSGPVFEGLAMTISRGQTLAIEGPSGAGKSSLLYTLGLLLQPWAGEVRLNGICTSNLRDSERSALRSKFVGFVFQDALLDSSRTTLDNVLEGALYGGKGTSNASRRALDLLEQIGIPSETLRSRLPSAISGGQAQRVALCRALLKNPLLILADEPTGNLDSDTGDLVLNALESEALRGAAVVVASHDPTVIEWAATRFSIG